jgi:hypothetical protein
MVTADDFRKQAAALYSLAKETTPAAERLELALEAMELEARAVDAERGKIVPPDVFPANASRDRENACEPHWADKGSARRKTGEAD